jgi:hypothetical protein
MDGLNVIQKQFVYVMALVVKGVVAIVMIVMILMMIHIETNLVGIQKESIALDYSVQF